MKKRQILWIGIIGLMISVAGFSGCKDDDDNDNVSVVPRDENVASLIGDWERTKIEFTFYGGYGSETEESHETILSFKEDNTFVISFVESGAVENGTYWQMGNFLTLVFSWEGSKSEKHGAGVEKYTIVTRNNGKELLLYSVGNIPNNEYIWGVETSTIEYYEKK